MLDKCVCVCVCVFSGGPPKNGCSSFKNDETTANLVLHLGSSEVYLAAPASKCVERAVTFLFQWRIAAVKELGSARVRPHKRLHPKGSQSFQPAVCHLVQLGVFKIGRSEAFAWGVVFG